MKTGNISRNRRLRNERFSVPVLHHHQSLVVQPSLNKASKLISSRVATGIEGTCKPSYLLTGRDGLSFG